MDTLEDKNSNFMEKYEKEEFNRVLRQIIDDLPPIEKEMIMLAYGFDSERMNQEALAQRFGEDLSIIITSGTLDRRMKIIRIFKKFKYYV